MQWQKKEKKKRKRKEGQFLTVLKFAQRLMNIENTLTPLKEIWRDYFHIGNIYRPSFIGEAKGDLLTHHFNVITAENIMKPTYLQPRPGEFFFDLADEMMDYAKKHSLKVVGHTLLWHEQSFDWIDEENTSKEEAIEILENHIYQVVGRYVRRNPGLVMAWDVINEAIDQRTNINPKDWEKHLRDTKWLRLIGPEFLNVAFHAAHKADPDAMLYYNDYNLNVPLKAQVVAYMIADLREQGVPVTSIGMQGHYSYHTPMVSARNSLELFSKIPGIKVSFTEVDITISGFEKETKLSHEMEIFQGQLYAQLFQVIRDYSFMIDRVTFWGMDDKSSWRGDRHPNLFRGDLSPKPAFFAVANPDQFLLEHPAGEAPEPKRAKAIYGKATVGEFNLESYTNAPVIPVNNQMTAWEGATGETKVLWDEDNLYILASIIDDTPDVSSETECEQDSIEFFVSCTNSRGLGYLKGDHHLWVNRKNAHSCYSASSIEGFVSYTKPTECGYQVEVKIPISGFGKEGAVLGFDLLINDGHQGMRRSFATWNDHSDTAWQMTLYWGDLLLER